MKIGCNDLKNFDEYIVSHFNEALEKGYLKLVFQPVVRTISDALCSIEGLSRWEDPTYGELDIESVIPVLENNKLIHILDIHVINEICKLFYERNKNNDPVMPVAFNLSRLDFYLCDIFDEVEKAVKKFDIPRDMICVEITESIFSQNIEVVTEAIKKFQASGYRIYMDDFGSGYSSLNVLKDYNFDLIKIDMEFLSTFNKRSKDIIASTIQMAKKIGIHTLAEGVETQEHYDFLKEIGCELVQGYLCGRPTQLDKLFENCISQGRLIETITWRKYFDAVGKIDFISDKPVCIVEYTPGSFIFRFMNESFNYVLTEIGVDKNILISDLNNGGSVCHFLNKFAMSIIDNGKHDSTVLPIGNNSLKIEANIISECNNYTMFFVSIVNITREEDKSFTRQLDGFLRNFMYLYDSIKYIDLNDRSYLEINKLTGYNIENEKKYDLDFFVNDYINNIIYKPDKERFKKFISREHIIQVLNELHKDSFTDFFRTRNKSGEYVWSEHTILMVPNTNHKIFFACVKPQTYNSSSIADIFKDKFKQYQFDNNNDIFYATLWKNLVATTNINFFWKDINRRFLGVSDSFLRTYGMESDKELIGKTDEEMNWHVVDDPYKNDELSVLKEGAIVKNSQGKCVIQGVVHNISANKFPVYLDGKIIGLLGYFVDVDDYNKALSINKVDSTYDPVTNVNNIRGFFEHLAGYNESFRLRRTDFSVVKVNVPEYVNIVRAYGNKVGNALLKLIADKIVINCMVSGSVAHIAEATFLIIYRHRDQADIKEFLTRLKNEIDDIHYILDYPVTLFSHIGLISASETSSIEDLIEKIVSLKV